MHTRTTDSPQVRRRAATPDSPPAPSIADTVAYWLEDEYGTRVTRLYRGAASPMRMAGRAFEQLEHLDGWSLVRRDTSGVRHVVASSADLAELARPFMPKRTPEEAAALAPFFAALRRITDQRDPDPEIMDKRVY